MTKIVKNWAIYFCGYASDPTGIPSFMETQILYTKEQAEYEADKYNAKALLYEQPAPGQTRIYEARLAPPGYGEEKEPETSTFADEVTNLLGDLATLLIAKNRKYGDAALNPKRIFSRASAVEQIKVRLDDKISRLMNQQPDEDEDVEWDLMGYLVLLRIAKKRQTPSE